MMGNCFMGVEPSILKGPSARAHVSTHSTPDDAPHLHQDAGDRQHGPPRMHPLRLREPCQALLVGAQAQRVPLQHMRVDVMSGS
jgi:hypothetical protein